MKTLLLIMNLFPLLLSAVKAIEEAVPLPGQGKKKLDLVLDIVKSAYDAGDDLLKGFAWDKVVQVAIPMITRIVASLNDLGLFKKSVTQPAQ
ncbi:MAG: hypothetical protein A3G20_03685 [Acidobacteria bacterium RIFCSPLOWO2_12_FULL_59_11]|nr:MAG: hypothetical protein A3G20_03685 [Acidobacteria bacterium RIFCSPLOWO2_12_FULL_59_11]